MLMGLEGAHDPFPELNVYIPFLFIFDTVIDFTVIVTAAGKRNPHK